MPTKHAPATRGFERPIPGLTDYVADDLGNVWSLRPWRGTNARIISPFINNHGYYTVRVLVDRKRVGYVSHKLICLAWHGKPKAGQEVRHLDGNRLNNIPVNLAWGTRSENARDRVKHGRNKSGENGRKATTAMLADGRLTRRANGTFQYRELGEE